MLLNDIFAKNVQRPIEGVIKADDASHLGTEVEEYVLTNEVAKGVEILLEAYTNYTNANGVWISGFFGSGKSHLLKMLAHLLGDVEGQAFDRTQVIDSFRAKVEGVIYGATLVSITPVGDDTYETTMALDAAVVDDIRSLYLQQLASVRSR